LVIVVGPDVPWMAIQGGYAPTTYQVVQWFTFLFFL